MQCCFQLDSPAAGTVSGFCFPGSYAFGNYGLRAVFFSTGCKRICRQDVELEK